MADMFDLRVEVDDLQAILRRRNLEERGKVQQFIDSEVLRLNESLIPKDTAALIQSGINHTQIGSGRVRYRTLYARRWYYMPANFQGAPERGNYWFERMKIRHLKEILSGAKQIAGAR